MSANSRKSASNSGFGMPPNNFTMRSMGSNGTHGPHTNRGEQAKSPHMGSDVQDPYAYFNIYRTLKVGSGNAAHINEFFCVPQAKFLGVTPQDIVDYKLPSHALKDIDIKRGKDAVKNDPFVKHHKEWQKALKLMLKKQHRAEQQALSLHGLNFVMEEYLPKKLKKTKDFLP